MKANTAFKSQVTRGVVYLAVGLIFLGWLINTPPGLLGKADALGYAVCHRIDGRSFHLGDRALPLCSRCSGMYLAATLSILYQAVARPRHSGMPGRSVTVVFGIFALLFAADGLNSYLSLFPGVSTLYQPQNWLRLLTGSGMGLAMAGVLMPAFNQTAWRQPMAEAAFPRLSSLVPVILLAGLIDLLVLTENPFLLYPLALISAAGIVILLTLVYSMVWMLFLKKENLFDILAQLCIFIVIGFGTALVQIILLDAARFWLTGSWEGFHLG